MSTTIARTIIGIEVTVAGLWETRAVEERKCQRHPSHKTNDREGSHCKWCGGTLSDSYAHWSTDLTKQLRLAEHIKSPASVATIRGWWKDMERPNDAGEYGIWELEDKTLILGLIVTGTGEKDPHEADLNVVIALRDRIKQHVVNAVLGTPEILPRLFTVLQDVDDG